MKKFLKNTNKGENTMKIEMGESLFYSWLRHVKECQIVQTNWKVSPQWNLKNETDLENLMKSVESLFLKKYNYNVFKKNSSLSQILQQGECDAIGITIQDGERQIYAVDVAFHENGLNYGSRSETVMKVIAKTVRTAMCLWGYMECKDAEIVFASPKITPSVLNDIIPCIEDINTIFSDNGYQFRARVIANEDFNDVVLQPILMASNGIADTSELFLRAYQMLNMFEQKNLKATQSHKTKGVTSKESFVDESKYQELKIGKIARVVLRKILEDEKISKDELLLLQQDEYSKKTFDIQYPLLVKADGEFDAVRYYTQPLYIYGENYLLCSQWFETVMNNDRPYLIKWIEEHE